MMSPVVMALIAQQQLLYSQLRLCNELIHRTFLSKRIVEIELILGQHFDNRLVLCQLPTLCTTLGSDDFEIIKPISSLDNSARVTLTNGMEFSLHQESNLGGLPIGTIIDYGNTYYIVEGNEFIGYRLVEMAGV